MFAKLLTALVCLSAGCSLSLEATEQSNSQPLVLSPLLRACDGKNYLLTTTMDEFKALRCGIAHYHLDGFEGGLSISPRLNTAPFYRLYQLDSQGTWEHIFTSNEQEKDHLVAATNFRVEGILGYISTVKTPDTTPLYRLRNPHFSFWLCTVSENERATLLRQHWVDEPVQRYVWKLRSSGALMENLYLENNSLDLQGWFQWDSNDGLSGYALPDPTWNHAFYEIGCPDCLVTSHSLQKFQITGDADAYPAAWQGRHWAILTAKSRTGGGNSVTAIAHYTLERTY